MVVGEMRREVVFNHAFSQSTEHAEEEGTSPSRALGQSRARCSEVSTGNELLDFIPHESRAFLQTIFLQKGHKFFLFFFFGHTVYHAES